MNRQIEIQFKFFLNSPVWRSIQPCIIYFCSVEALQLQTALRFFFLSQQSALQPVFSLALDSTFRVRH